MNGRDPVGLRPATAADSQAIRLLILRVGINPRDLDWHRFLLAVDEQDRMVGCGQVKPHGDGSRELASIAVSSSWRGRGVASTVIQRLMAQTGPPLWLVCRSTLTGFYRRFGFVQVRDAERMPRRFRRMYRWLAAAARYLPGENPMAVMVWEGASPAGPGDDAVSGR